MSETVMTHIIARIRTDFPTKFGIPRQSGLADVPARIVFEPEYRNADALRGIEEYSHLWLIWQFSEAVRERNMLTKAKSVFSVATNVPAEKKPMNSDSPLIHQGTLPPPAKKLFIFLPVEENSEPTNMMPAAKTAMVM